jgi:hypothetical protein
MTRAKLTRFLLLVVCAGLAACGRESELAENQSAQLQSALAANLGSENPVSKKQFQDELQLVMTEVNTAVAQALIPGVDTRALTTTAAAASCAPKFNFVLIGVGITFTPGNGCVLSGTVDVKLFPTTVNVNLTAVGLSFIDKITLNGSVILGGNTAMTLTFLNGRIDIKQIAGINIGTVVINGTVALNTSPSIKFASRINAFTAATKGGVALLATIDPAAGVTNIQGCLLAGADPQNPQAGTAFPCFGI